jgi:hypothetical protein
MIREPDADFGIPVELNDVMPYQVLNVSYYEKANRLHIDVGEVRDIAYHATQRSDGTVVIQESPVGFIDMERLAEYDARELDEKEDVGILEQIGIIDCLIGARQPGIETAVQWER